MLNLPPPPVILYDTQGAILFAARVHDTDEQAIRAACHRGVQLPQLVVVRRVGTEPRVYEVFGEGKVIVLDKEETEKLTAKKQPEP